MLNQALIFTDLDGTLLDHHSYSFAAAIPMLEKLRNSQIPVIPNTSKTFAELGQIRQEIGLSGPFVVENGAAIYIPVGYFDSQPKDTLCLNGFWVKEFTKPRREWLALIDNVKSTFVGEFEQFTSMSHSQISAVTGLSLQQAASADTREYGEPVLWLSSSSSKQLFIKALEALGAQPLQGGRFLHVSGDCDKGQALLWLQTQYSKQRKIPTVSIALGDGQNDIAMLEAANIAVRILSPVNPPPALNKPKDVYTSKDYGPKGWINCLQDIIYSPNNSLKVHR
jgi:mannosyl-3-phosphoglycerate phosphatase